MSMREYAEGDAKEVVRIVWLRYINLKRGEVDCSVRVQAYLGEVTRKEADLRDALSDLYKIPIANVLFEVQPTFSKVTSRSTIDYFNKGTFDAKDLSGARMIGCSIRMLCRVSKEWAGESDAAENLVKRIIEEV